jgi:hypothetical protein
MAKKMFKNLKQQDRNKLYFESIGFYEIKDVTTSKYRVFVTDVKFIFLGKSGAIRASHSRAATHSRDVHGIYSRKIIEWAGEQNQTEMQEV